MAGQFYKYATPTALNGFEATGKIYMPPQVAVRTAVEKIHFDGAHFRRDIARGIVNRETRESHEMLLRHSTRGQTDCINLTVGKIQP